MKSPLDAIYAIIWKYIWHAELKVKSSGFINSQKSYPPIESGRYINWFSSILRVVTFFNEPIEERNNTQFSSLNYKQVNQQSMWAQMTFDINHKKFS